MGKFKGSLLLALIALLCACKGSSSSSAPSFNLEPLQPFTGVSDWTASGGGPSHSGYVPVTLDASRFSARWSVNLPPGNTTPCGVDFGFSCAELSSAVTDSADGHVVLTVDTVVQTANVDADDLALYSLNEMDGSVAWSTSGFPFDDDNEDSHVNNFSVPSVADGKVYMSFFVDIQQPLLTPPQLPVLDAFDAKTGARVFSVNPPCAATPCNNFAYSVTQPVISGSTLFTGGSLSAFDAGDGTLLWTSGGGAAPAVDLQAAYVSGEVASTSISAFTALDRASGVPLFQITPSAAEVAAYRGGGAASPVLDSAGGAIVQRGRVMDRYQLATHVLDWEVVGAFDGLPVAGNSMVFVCDGTGVSGYDITQGTLLFSWTPPASDVSLRPVQGTFTNCSMVVTNDILFVSSAKATYAVDIDSKQLQWSYGEGGSISISPSGLLYISVNAPEDPTTGTTTKLPHLVAINLH